MQVNVLLFYSKTTFSVYLFVNIVIVRAELIMS